MKFRSYSLLLLATTGVSAISVATGAMAQDAGANAPGQLEEVVVTATRQAESLNRVPLSVSAQTQRSMDQIGIRTIGDLVGRVPALNIAQNGPGISSVTIRGIANTAASPTAATTGFYLDDTPLQKRNTRGIANSPSSGTPLPVLFDLDRVEVLRGPQGTLFGGGSEGGTIRYITAQPSLTRYSAYARGEVSTIRHGGETYEGGAAIGGPILQDKLGFRVSFFDRHSAGWIDGVDGITRQVSSKDVNSGNTRVFKGALTWAPTEETRVTFSYFSSSDATKSINTAYGLPVGTITEAPACYAPGANFFSPNACAPGQTPTRPGATYGPYNLGPFQAVDTGLVSPSRTQLTIPTLTLEYNAPSFSVKSITSYVHDNSKAEQYLPLEMGLRGGQYSLAGGPSWVQGLGVSSVCPDAQMEESACRSWSYGRNERYGLTQEIRFSSAADARPLSWVGGVFYSNMRTKTDQLILQNADVYGARFYGNPNTVSRWGQPLIAVPGTNLALLWQDELNNLKDTEFAAFGEVNYWITDRLRATAGIRLSHVQFDYAQTLYGPAAGLLAEDGLTGSPGRTPSPTIANRGRTFGQTTEDPVTPKVGLQYQISDNDMVYVTASKGFRTGGVNGVSTPGVCSVQYQAARIDQNTLPRTFNSDSVWSYEGGAKLRVLNNRVQINGSVYRIDWNNVQFETSVGGCAFISNAATARVQGGELEINANPFPGLTANFAAGYTDAKYKSDVRSPRGDGTPGSLLSFNGQPFAQPKWTVNVGVRYDHAVTSKANGYARVDWRWSDGYRRSFINLPGFAPDAATAPAIDRTNIRVGVEFNGFDLNVFANNVFDQNDGFITGGRGTCAINTTNCTSYAPFLTVNGAGMPRQIGVQLAFRH